MDKHAVSADREHRRDFVPLLPGATDRVGPPRRQTGPAAGQHQGGHDIHGRLQHGPWDMASIHASEATLAATKAAFPHVVLCFIPPRSTSYMQPCDVAVFRSFKSCIQAYASATLARSVIDGSFEGLAMNKSWRRQSSAEWAARAATELCDENKVWSTGWRQLRAQRRRIPRGC